MQVSGSRSCSRRQAARARVRRRRRRCAGAPRRCCMPARASSKATRRATPCSARGACAQHGGEAEDQRPRAADAARARPARPDAGDAAARAVAARRCVVLRRTRLVGAAAVWLPPIEQAVLRGRRQRRGGCRSAPAASSSCIPISSLLSSTTCPSRCGQSITILRFAGSEPAATGQPSRPRPRSRRPAAARCATARRPDAARAALDELPGDVHVADLRRDRSCSRRPDRRVISSALSVRVQAREVGRLVEQRSGVCDGLDHAARRAAARNVAVSTSTSPR